MIVATRLSGINNLTPLDRTAKTSRSSLVVGGVGSKKRANMSARSQLAQDMALARQVEDAAAADRKEWRTLYRNMLDAVDGDAAVAEAAAVVARKEVKRATRSRRHARSLENEPHIKECIRKCHYSCRKKGGKSKRRRATKRRRPTKRRR